VPSPPPPEVVVEPTTIQLALGWTWLSLNMQTALPGGGNMAVGDLFAGITLYDGDYMKSQSSFTQYYESFSVFYGTLDTLLNTEMYKAKMQAAAGRSPPSITLTGTPVELPLNAVVATGWNYMPCPYQTPQAVTDAVPDITYYQGDLIKSQTDFATFYDIPATAASAAFRGWYGQLTTIEPGQGYKLMTCRVEEATASCDVVVPGFSGFGSPMYRAPPAGRRQLQAPTSAPAQATILPAGWALDVTLHAETMTLTTVVMIDNEFPVSGALAALVGDNVHGVSRSPTIAPFGPHKGMPLWFITIYGESSDAVTFKFASEGTTIALDKSLPFKPDGNQGSVLTPFVLAKDTRSKLFA
jgi:hypothetical protein